MSEPAEAASDARQEGADAFARGVAHRLNPYPADFENAARRLEWGQGWLAAEQRAEARR